MDDPTHGDEPIEAVAAEPTERAEPPGLPLTVTSVEAADTIHTYGEAITPTGWRVTAEHPQNLAKVEFISRHPVTPGAMIRMTLTGVPS